MGNETCKYLPFFSWICLSLLFSGCQSGQFFGGVFTATPTPTCTNTPTLRQLYAYANFNSHFNTHSDLNPCQHKLQQSPGNKNRFYSNITHGRNDAHVCPCGKFCNGSNEDQFQSALGLCVKARGHGQVSDLINEWKTAIQSIWILSGSTKPK